MPVMSIAEALRSAIREEMRRDPAVFCLGEDIGIPGGFGGAFTVTLGLSEEFGHERILDTPISELGFIGAAVGAALGGMRPIADVQYGDFLFCAMDQIASNMAKLTYMSGGLVKLPIVLRAPIGASTRGAQHAHSMEAWFTHLPGLKVICPGTAYDAKGLLKTAVRDDNPVLIFEHKLLYGSKGNRAEPGALSPMGEVPEEEYLIPFGRGVIRRPGRHVTVVATLVMQYRALAVANRLAEEGIEAEVIDPRTLVPFDYDMVLTSLRKTGRLVIVEEDTRRGGWGAEIAATVAEEAFYDLDAPIRRVASHDTPVPTSPVLEQFHLPSEGRIEEAIRSVMTD